MNDFETDIIDIPQDTIDKNNPTPDTSGGSAGTTGNTLQQTDIDNLGKKLTSGDFVGYYFESQDGKVKAQVVRMDDGTGVTINALKLKTEAGNRNYEIPSARNANTPNDDYRVFVCRTINGNTTTEATFRNGGTLELKLQNSSGESYTLKLALKGKYTDDKIGN